MIVVSAYRMLTSESRTENLVDTFYDQNVNMVLGYHKIIRNIEALDSDKFQVQHELWMLPDMFCFPSMF